MFLYSSAHLCLGRHTSWLSLHVCSNAVVLIHWHVFESDAVDKPLCPLANRICGCSFWALAPFLLFLVFCCLLRCSLWRNASLAGGFAGRRVWLFLWFLCVVLFDLPAQNGHFMSLYKRLSDCLCSCKDRAFSATSAKLEGKKRLFHDLRRHLIFRTQAFDKFVHDKVSAST